jgi:hypothetical protein
MIAQTLLRKGSLPTFKTEGASCFTSFVNIIIVASFLLVLRFSVGMLHL